MIEQIINGIKYRLNEETFTAAVTCLLKGDSIEDYVGDIKIPGTVEFDGVPYCVTSIDEETFFDCKSLTSITIPESLTSIEWWAFCGCKSLTDITFQGTIAQWKKINIRDSWKHNIPATVVHCTDGDVEI